jgi:hypothetical protein
MLQNPVGFPIAGHPLKSEKGRFGAVCSFIQLLFSFVISQPYFFILEHS